MSVSITTTTAVDVSISPQCYVYNNLSSYKVHRDCCWCLHISPRICIKFSVTAVAMSICSSSILLIYVKSTTNIIRLMLMPTAADTVSISSITTALLLLQYTVSDRVSSREPPQRLLLLLLMMIILYRESQIHYCSYTYIHLITLHPVPGRHWSLWTPQHHPL